MATDRICSIPNCGKSTYSRGWCSTHHSRWKRRGSPLDAGRVRMDAKGLLCSFEGCARAVHGRGLCITHYARLRKNGSPSDAGKNQLAAIEWIKGHVGYSGAECLIWPFGRFQKSGYARIMVDGVGHTAHRVLCRHAKGEPPTAEHEAAHSCGNGHEACMNQNHLRWATSKENHGDRFIHDTVAKGERNGQSKLTEQDVIKIRGLFGSMKQSEIARRFNVGDSVISYIKLGKSWRHV